MDEDEDFDDADFDDLPAGTLHALEQKALLSTQQARSGNDTRRTDDYGLDDEQVVDLNAGTDVASKVQAVDKRRAVDEVTQREQWRAQRYGAGAARMGPGLSTAKNGQNEQVSTEAIGGGGGQDVAALRAQIAQLEQAALAKAGEISIVRSNAERVTKEHQRKLDEMQQQMRDAATRHKADQNAWDKERERLATDQKFLQHDLKQQTEQQRNARRQASASGLAVRGASPLSTPTKKRTVDHALGDGFDDSEMVTVMSPSRPKPATPAGTKRKRSDLLKSPAASLSAAVDQQQQPTRPSSDAGTPLPDDAPAEQHGDGDEDETARLTQKILEHRTRDGRRFLQVMSSLSFSSAQESMASSIYDSLKPPWPDPSLHTLQVCNALLSTWRRCLDEKTYAPLQDITDLLTRLVVDGPPWTAVNLVPTALPLCRSTANLVAVPRFTLAKNATTEQPPTEETQRHIRPYDVLVLLEALSTACDVDSLSSLKSFWTHMEQDFVLLMLAKGQPLSHTRLMLSLLTSSALPDSFGVRANPSKLLTPDESLEVLQSQSQAGLITRLTVLLVHAPPKPPALPDADDAALEPVDNESYSAASILALRSAVLALLTHAATTSHGAAALASHRLLTGRLVRFLHDAVASLPSLLPASHAARTAHANAAVLLLARLSLPLPSSEETEGEDARQSGDVRAKLLTEPAGAAKHLIALARVAFAERATDVEAGIWSEAAEAAHGLLDEMLSPVEGDDVVAVYAPLAAAAAAAAAVSR